MCNRYRPARGDQLELDLGYEPQFVGEPPGLRFLKDIGPRQQGVFLRPKRGERLLQEVFGTWGIIGDSWKSPEPPKIGKRPQMTNNARMETIAELRTFSGPWARGQRCIIPAAWWVEPNWETGKNVWWRLRIGGPLATGLAGLWNTWTDKTTGEVFESYAMVTLNCDHHPLLNRMHRPDPDRPPEKQDKRAVVPLAREAFEAWLFGGDAEARAALCLPEPSAFEAAPEGSATLASPGATDRLF